MARGSVWETNFESEFEAADDAAPKVVDALVELKPFGRNLSELAQMARLFFKRERHLRDTCKFYHLDENLHRDLLLVIVSLLIRNPSNRFRYESYSTMVGLPPCEEVGKANMSQNFRIAAKLCKTGFLSNQYFVLIHSPLKKFICGDGSLDWLTSGLVANSLNGRALVPLTPHLCVYICTPRAMPTTPNCASFSAAPWMVDWINNLVQIYSRDKLFFRGKPPKLIDAFRRREFLEHQSYSDDLLRMLDEIAGVERKRMFGVLGALDR